MDDGGTVRLERTENSGGWVAHLIIDHSRRRNAIGPAVISALTSQAAKVSQDPSLRAVTLTGAGPLFAAGANVKVMSKLDPDSARTFITSLHVAINTVRRIPVPVIAVLRGHCYGAAMELAAACDMRIADPTLVAGMPEVRVGIPSVIEACLLPRLLGWGKTSELLLTGRDMGAEEALSAGFIQRLVPAERMEDAVFTWTNAISACAPGAVRAQKAIMHSWEPDQSAAIDTSIDRFAAAFETGEPQQFLPGARRAGPL